MNKLWMIFGLCILLSIISVSAVCNSTVNNTATSLTTDMTLCAGTYKNVSFTINANSIVLDCNGSTILAQTNG